MKFEIWIVIGLHFIFAGLLAMIALTLYSVSDSAEGSILGIATFILFLDGLDLWSRSRK